jgi:peptidoglycan/LPS O-acetylase OafA/YrhL
MLTWNFPSWSISTEFYAYAIFASVLLVLRSWIYVFVIFVFVAAPAFLLVFVGHIDSQYDFGIIRCVFGFFVGFACFDLYVIVGARTKVGGLPSVAICSCFEALCVAAVVFFVCFCSSGPFSLAAPWVFGLTVLTFSFQRGVISKILEAQPFLFIGALSYSIYMMHWLVDVGMQYALRLAEREWKINLFYEGRIGAYMWQGDIAYGFTLLLVIYISYLTFKFIEEPGRRQTRSISNMIFSATESSSFPQTNGYILQSLSPSDPSQSQRAKNHATPL